jgi:diguanylate cyclase
MSSEVDNLSASVRDSADLAQLRSSVIASLDRMQSHVRSHLEEENTRREAAESEAAGLRGRLRRLEQDTFDLRRQVAQNQAQAMSDPLTGLPNRRAYEQRMQQEYARWRRFGEPLALVVWDVDNFKAINDTFGHKSGDKALAMIAKILRSRLRETDFVARYGGEEFVTLLTGADGQAALQVADAMRTAVEDGGLHANGQPVAITLSGGLSVFAVGDSPEGVFERADRAMYQAKRQGKNAVVRG